MSNTEKYLAFLAGEYDGELPQPGPIRKELYLAAMCGLEVPELPLPVTKADVYMYNLAVNGVGSGEGPVITDAGYLFYNGNRLNIMDDLLRMCKDATNMENMFGENRNTLTELDLSGLDTSSVTNMKQMFYYCSRLSKIIGLDAFDTGNVTTMEGMFNSCSKLAEIDLSNFNTSNVASMMRMFLGCSNLTTLDLTNFDTSNVEYFQNMFYNCTRLETLLLGKFGSDKAKSFEYMFGGCSSLKELDLSEFDTSQATSLSQMFYGCTSLKSLDLSNFDTSNVSSMSAMFGSSSIYSAPLTIESITGFSAMKSAGMNISFPIGAEHYESTLKRLTFRTDLPEGKYAIRSAINIKYCDFDNTGMQEMLDTITDVSGLGLSSSYTTITITGNPCLTGTRKDGTVCDLLTDEIRNGFLAKGWTLVE